ncbi:MAG: hypothetical protein R2932_49280 [Caldilineaceae bacterium]
MAETVRNLNLNVDPEIPGMLAELAGGQRRMGIHLSDLIRSAHTGIETAGKPGELEMLTGSIRHLSAKVKELDGRLQLVEERF